MYFINYKIVTRFLQIRGLGQNRLHILDGLKTQPRHRNICSL